VAAHLASFSGFHHRLEQRPEDRWRNPGPIEPGAGQQSVAHRAGEGRKTKPLSEQRAVDIGEAGKHLVEICLALLGRGIEHLEQLSQVQTQVRAVRHSTVLEIEAKRLAFEEARIFREKTEQYTDQETFEGVPVIASRIEGIMEVSKDLDGFDVDGVLILEAVLLVTGNEGKRLDIVVKFG